MARTRDLPVLIEPSEPQTPPATSRTATAPKRLPRWSWLLVAVGTAVVGVIELGRLGRQITDLPPANQAAVAPAPSGHMHLVTVPEGALIERDGKPIDRTPATIDLQPGTAALRLSLDGYEAETIALDVAPGATIDRTVTLRPGPPGPRMGATSAKEAESSGVSPTGLSPHATPKAAASQRPHLKIRVLDDGDSP